MIKRILCIVNPCHLKCCKKKPRWFLKPSGFAITRANNKPIKVMIKRTICIENPCHLKCRNGQLVVDYHHIKGYETVPEKTAPIEDIGIIILEHQQITISQYLLDKLVANNAAVIICNETHHPSGMLLPLESNTIQSERFRAQIEATEPLKKQLWQQKP